METIPASGLSTCELFLEMFRGPRLAPSGARRSSPPIARGRTGGPSLPALGKPTPALRPLTMDSVQRANRFGIQRSRKIEKQTPRERDGKRITCDDVEGHRHRQRFQEQILRTAALPKQPKRSSCSRFPYESA